MARDSEKFLARWSRRKSEARQAPQPEAPLKPEESAPPALPPVEELTPESDFSVFMHPKVQDALRRVALKKLFSDPHFNVPDPFEAYSGDWTGGEPISDEMLATLNQARRLLFDEAQEKKAEEAQQVAAAEPEPVQEHEQEQERKDDEPGRQEA